MKILVVTHYFPPEIGAPQARLSELTRYWALAGSDVCVLTGMPNHPTGVVPEPYRKKLRVEERKDGYGVVRTWVYATPNEGLIKKTLGHVSFMVTSVVLGLSRIGPTDAVVVSSPTFFSIFSAWALARIRRARFVVEVRDLWPAIFVELGVLKNRAVIRLLERLELAAYHAADAVVVVSGGFRNDLVRRGVAPGKVHVIRNGVDLDLFTPRQLDPATLERVRSRLGATSEDMLVLYIGSHGISHGLAGVADAAAVLHGDPIHFTFVGEGAAKWQLERHVTALQLDNVTLLPAVARDEVPDLLAAADVCLVPLRDVPLFSTFIPSKIFEYFGAGKAVVGAVRGEPAAILREGGAVVVEPETPEDLADAIRTLANEPARRSAMGRRARAYVESHFDRRQLADDYLQILIGLVPSARG